MATLPTGSFSLRALPEVRAIDPRFFTGAPEAAARGFQGSISLLSDVESLREQQRRGRLARATQPGREQLALMQTEEALRALPETAELESARRGFTLRALPEQATVDSQRRRQELEEAPLAAAEREAERIANLRVLETRGLPTETRIVETPGGRFAETVTIAPSEPGYEDAARTVTDRRQLATPTQLSTERERLAAETAERGARTRANEARATQLLRPRPPASKVVTVGRNRQVLMRPVVDEETGEVLDWEAVETTASPATPQRAAPTAQAEPTAAAPAAAASTDLPVLTPAQVANAPSGTRFRTTDGRILRKP